MNEPPVGFRPADRAADQEPQVLELSGGRRVSVRPLTDDDEQRLHRAYDQADPGALRLRFAGSAPSFAALAQRLHHMDGHARYAVGAFAPGDDLVGVAQYVQTTPGGAADVAVIVSPGWQHQGVGGALLAGLRAHALTEGITSATAMVSGSNAQVQELLRELRTPHTVTYDQGVGTVRVDLTATVPAPPGHPMPRGIRDPRAEF